jgi:CRISPR/Cas system-associated exonuclease Cas4 (RecB family)
VANKLNGEITFRKAEDTPGFSGANLIRVLEAEYLKKRRPDAHTQKVSFAPSSIGYGHAVCPRYWYLAFDGGQFVETSAAWNMAVMEHGTSAHRRLQDLFKSAGILVAEETELKMTDPPIRGYMDVLVRWPGEADSIVGEIKTTSENVFVGKRLSMKPSPNHLLQILIYMKITGKKKGFLMYENRNDLSLLVIEVQWNEVNEKILEDALSWMRTTHKAWVDRELPKRPFRSQAGKVCQSCPLNKVCWEEVLDGTNKIGKMEVPTVT